MVRNHCRTQPALCVRPRCVCSVLRAHVQFCRLKRRTPLPTFSDTAITDRHSDTTFFQLRAHWVRISWSIGSEKSFGHVPPVGVEHSTSCVQGEHPIHKARLSAFLCSWTLANFYNQRRTKKRRIKHRIHVHV